MPTLKELKVDVGDVVNYQGWSEYEIMPDKQLKNTLSGMISSYTYNWDSADGFTLVSKSEYKNAIVLGGKYTIKDKVWECIFVEDGLAWMRINKYGSAYIWNTDGTAITMGKGHSVKWAEKVVKSVTVLGLGIPYVLDDNSDAHYMTEDFRATVLTVNGKPNWKTLKLTSEDS